MKCRSPGGAEPMDPDPFTEQEDTMGRHFMMGLTVIGLVTGFATAASATDVALFFNPTYTNTGTDCDNNVFTPADEACNLKKSLEAQGFNVFTFTGITGT